MSAAEIVLVSSLAFSLLIWLYLISRRASYSLKVTSLRGSVTSWTFLFLHVVVTNVVIQSREHNELVESGLSFQNIVQIAVILSAFLWAVWVLLRGWVPLSNFTRNCNIWMIALVGVYAVTTTWSVWPELTALRVVELISFWVIVMHLFCHYDWEDRLGRYLWGITFILVAYALFLVVVAVINDLNILKLARSNLGGMVAAVLMLYVSYRVIYTKERSVVGVLGWSFPLLALLLFNSLASLVAFGAALCVLLFFRGGSYFRAALISVFISLFVVNIMLITEGNWSSKDNWLYQTAKLVGKNERQLTTFSGRFPLWKELWVQLKDEPAGLGYVAGERLFEVIFSASKSTGWKASNAHNGYVSTWVGAGWLGIVLLLLLFISVIRKCLNSNLRTKPFLVSTVVLIAINNMTLVAVGGQLSPGWVVLLAFCAIPSTVRSKNNVYVEALTSKGNN